MSFAKHTKSTPTTMYNLSQDYERLYQLMQEEKDPVCVKGKYLFQFIQDDLEMYFDKESFITYCKDFNLQWIDPQPVAENDIDDMFFAAGQQSIIEQLKGLQRYSEIIVKGHNGNYIDITMSETGNHIEYADIETIINEHK